MFISSMSGLGASNVQQPVSQMPQQVGNLKDNAWYSLDAVYPKLFAAALQAQRSALMFTLNFSGASKSWQANQVEQMPQFVLLLFAVARVLNLPSNVSAERNILYLRAMAEYAEKTKVPADQAAAFNLVRTIVWKWESDQTGTNWSPFVNKNKTAEISAVATAVAQGKFKNFEKVYADLLKNNARWFGSFIDVYSTTGTFNQALLNKTGVILKDAFFKPIPYSFRAATPGTQPNVTSGAASVVATASFMGGQTAHFAALVAAVNTVLGFPAGNGKNIATATSDVLKVLRYIQSAAPKSTLGQAVDLWFNWSKSSYYKLRTEDVARIASQIEAKGGLTKVSDKINAWLAQPIRTATPAEQKASAKAIEERFAREDAEYKARIAREAAAQKQASAVAAQKQASAVAAAQIRIAASNNNVKPALVTKVAAKHTTFFTKKLREKLVINTSRLIDQRKTQEALLTQTQQALSLAQAKVETAATPAAAQIAQTEVAAATAAVEQAQTAVAATTQQVAASEQAIAQVDAAAATAAAATQTAEQAAAVPPSAPPATAAAAETASNEAATAASDAASAATAAAAAVLPPEEVAEAAKESVSEIKEEAAKVAEQTGDDSIIKATEAAAESNVVKDAVKEGAAVAQDLKKAAGGSNLALLLGGAALAFLIFRK